MTIHSWLIYLSLVIVATGTPGPAVLFIVTHSTLHGWRKAVFAALGNIAGLFCLGILAVTGLGAVLKTSELVFNLIKYAGSAYLIYLGLKMMFRKNVSIAGVDGRTSGGEVTGHKLFFQAFGIAMSNPKAIVFLTALFPPFINVDQGLVPQFSILISTLMALSLGFLMTYAVLAHRTRAWLAGPSRIRMVNRASGSVFIGFGALLAASSNR